MIEIFLNTQEQRFLDNTGKMFSSSMPELTIGGEETFCFFLKNSTPDWGMAAARPSEWPADTSWSEIPGISAMLTIDDDYQKYTSAKLANSEEKGSQELTVILGSTDEVPREGVLKLITGDDDEAYVYYSSRRKESGKVIFILESGIPDALESGSTVYLQQEPLAQAYLDASQSNWQKGELFFTLNVDSYRMRRLLDKNPSATVRIHGIELLLYSSAEDGSTKIYKAFLLDSAKLLNVHGFPGFPADVPDPMRNNISAEVDQRINSLKETVLPKINSAGKWEVDGKDTGVSASGPAAGFGTVSAEIEMLPPGSQASAEVETSGPDTQKDMIFKLSIPEGTGQGGGGITGKILFDMTGSLADKVFYDDEKKYFTYLTTGGDLYVKLSDTSGDWSEPVHIAPVRGVDYWTDEDKETIKNEMLNKGW